MGHLIRACATSSGVFNNYAGAERESGHSVNIAVPRVEQLIYAITLLREKS